MKKLIKVLIKFLNPFLLILSNLIYDKTCLGQEMINLFKHSILIILISKENIQKIQIFLKISFQ